MVLVVDVEVSQFQRTVSGIRERTSRRFGVGLLVRRGPDKAEATPKIVSGIMTDLISLVVKSYKLYKEDVRVLSCWNI